MSSSAYFRPFGVDISLEDGAMTDPDTHRIVKASTMHGYYLDETALERLIEKHGDPVHYEVFEKKIPEQDGHVRTCISKLYPGRVGDECFFTKGHYHTKLHTAETYLCISGEGFMLMKTRDGERAWEPFKPGRMVYVPPCWAHRSVNTGDVPLVTFCNYPADAGHNYGDIVDEGFPMRVFIRDGEVVIE